MKNLTPLRYPGGKKRLFSLVTDLLKHNKLKDIDYFEPFAGGAAIGLGLLMEEYASTIHLNDLSRPVFAFWDAVVNDSAWLCERIRKVRVSMAEWYRQRAVYLDQGNADLRELGFSTLFLNRTNRSGILGAGVIGGKNQAGPWSMECRFSKDELIARVQKIARFRSRIFVHQLDASDFLKKAPEVSAKGFLFIDPPYIEKSGTLYLNNYSTSDHVELANQIADLQIPWIVTYDLPAIENKLFPKHRRIVYDIEYTAQKKYKSREVMYLSNSLALPKVQELLGARLRHVPSMSRLLRKTAG